MVIAPRRMVVALTTSVLVTTAIPAHAEPYRLRADAFFEAPDASGFVQVQTEARERGDVLVDAEALMWTGVGPNDERTPEAQGEAVVASVRVRDPMGRGGARFGRLLFWGGAIRPLHFDGLVLEARAPTGAAIEVFGGIPVAPGWRGRSYDWLLGYRYTQGIDEYARVGFSYFQERDAGQTAREEVGVEGSLLPFDALALRATAALDVLRTGLAEARVSAVLHDRVNRLEVFGVRRSPSRMLPATSLFAAIGSFDTDALGVTGFWRAAPRLDLSATATVDSVQQQPGATQMLRAELKFDDDGRGAIGVEARRVSMPDTSWTGGRAWLRVPLVAELRASTEIEAAVPDEPRDRGSVWPWALAALSYAANRHIDAAAAVEVSATPQYSTSVGALFRVSGEWGVP